MYPDKVYKAAVIEVSKGTTRNNLSYLLTALLPNPDRKLLAGMSGKVYMDISTDQKAGVVIPQYALCHRPEVGNQRKYFQSKSAQGDKRRFTAQWQGTYNQRTFRR